MRAGRHPIGVELRCEVQRDLKRSEALHGRDEGRGGCAGLAAAVRGARMELSREDKVRLAELSDARE